MAEIKRTDIFAKNVFTDPAKEAEMLDDALNMVEKSLKDIAKLSAEAVKNFKVADSKDLKEFNEALGRSKKAVSDLDEFEKRRLKTLKKLKEANSTRIEDLTELQVQLQEQNKANKQLAKEKLGLIGAYQKESARLVKLRKEYKDLAVQNKENTDEGKKLLKNITTLDKKLKDIDETVGQNQRSVGDYKKAVEGLNSTIGKLGIVAIVAKGFDLLKDAFGDTREGALALQIAFSKFTVTARVFINNIINAGSGVKDLFVAIFNTFEAIGVRAELTIKKIDLSISKLPSTVARLEGEISVLEDKLSELEKTKVSDAIDKIAKAFDGTVDNTKRALDAEKDYLELQLKTRIQIEEQERALAGLAEKRQILQDISDDDTIGFLTRAAAVEKAREAAIKFSELELKLAKTRERLTIDAVKQSLREANALTEAQLDQIKSGEQLEEALTRRLSFYKKLEEGEEDVLIALKVSDEADEAFTAAFLERINKQVEAEAFRRDQGEKNRKTARDAFEQELDILEEFTEKRIANNEQIIGSDSESLEARRIALLENQALEQELLEASIDLILKQGKASIDLRQKEIEQSKTLNDEKKKEKIALLEEQKALLTREAIQKILNEQDAQEIFNLIRKLDLGEIEEKRLKETLKIKEDTAKVNKDSSEAEQEAALKTSELLDDIALQEKVLAGEQVDLEDERLKKQEESLRKRIELAKEGSIEQLELQKELNDLLIEEDKKAAEERQKIRDAELEAAQDLANEIIDLTLEELAKKDEARLQAIDDQISGQEELIAKLRENAEKGTEEALAFEEAQLEKQRLARQREEERQAKRNEAIQLAQTFLNQVAEQSKENPDTAIAEAFKNTFLARAIARGLAGFFEGTDDTGSGDGRLSDKYGNITGYTHENEMVFSAKQKAALGHKTREEIIDIVQDYDAGNTWAFMPRLEQIEQPKGLDLSEVVESNNRVVKAIRENAVHSEFDLSGFNYWIEERIKGSQKEVIKHMIEKFRR